MQRVKRRIFSGAVCEQVVFTVPDRLKNLDKAEPRPRFKTEEERAAHKLGISRRKHARIVNNNFGPTSLYSTLTMDDEHEVHTFQEARKVRDNFYNRLMYHAPGAKIMIYMGRGKNTHRIHFHMILSAKDTSLERVLALTERATRYQVNLKIKNGETATVVAALDALERKLGAAFSKVFQTITVDNGSEFADVEGLERTCTHSEEKRTTLYYCHPYSSSERGSNEKQNGMTRRRHPKGTDFKKVSKKKLRETTDWINNYPRKIFGFHTAAELFAAAFPDLPALY